MTPLQKFTKGRINIKYSSVPVQNCSRFFVLSNTPQNVSNHNRINFFCSLFACPASCRFVSVCEDCVPWTMEAQHQLNPSTPHPLLQNNGFSVQIVPIALFALLVWQLFPPPLPLPPALAFLPLQHTQHVEVIYQVKMERCACISVVCASNPSLQPSSALPYSSRSEDCLKMVVAGGDFAYGSVSMPIRALPSSSPKTKRRAVAGAMVIALVSVCALICTFFVSRMDSDQSLQQHSFNPMIGDLAQKKARLSTPDAVPLPPGNILWHQ